MHPEKQQNKMREPANLANALVIIACLYFLISGGFNIWTLFLLLFSIVTWEVVHFPKSSKDEEKRRNAERRAKIVNLNAHSQFMLTQTRVMEKTLANGQ